MNHDPISMRLLAQDCSLLSTIQEDSDSIVLKRAANSLRDYAATIELLHALRAQLSKTTSLVTTSLVIDSINDALDGES